MKLLLLVGTSATAVTLAIGGCGGDDSKPVATTTVTAPPVTTTEAQATTTAARSNEPATVSCGTQLTYRNESATCDLDSGGMAKVAAVGKTLKYKDIGVRILSVRKAKSVADTESGELKTQTAQAGARYVLVKLRIQNRGNKSLDWGNLLDGRSVLLVGEKSFNHDGDVESNIPGQLYLGEIPPDGYQVRTMAYEVTRKSLPDLGTAVLALVSTRQLEEENEDPTTASSLGLLHVPRVGS